MELPIVGCDTEYNNEYVPFVATTCDEQLNGKIYDTKHSSKDTAKIKEICEDRNVVKVFHAACNDLYAFSKIGIKVRNVEDTMIAASLLNENFESKRLKSLAKIYLNEPCDEEKALSKVKSKLKREAKKEGREFSYEDIPPEILKPYAIKDPSYNIKLWYLFKEPLKKYQAIYDMEKSLIPIIVRMVKRGIKIDRKFVADQITTNAAHIEEAYKDMCAILKENGLRFRIPIRKRLTRSYEKTKESLDKFCKKQNCTVLHERVEYWKGQPTLYAMLEQAFNPGSTPHLRKAVKKLGIPITVLTNPFDDDTVSTESRVIQPFEDDHPFVKHLLKYRFYTKQNTTYYRPLYYRYTSEEHPYAHFMLYQSGAKTGRFTASLIQTIPRNEESRTAKQVNHVRKAFIPRKGYKFVFVDFDQIEMRLFAHYSKCELLIDAIKAGFDPHLGTAITLFGEDVVLKNGDDIKKLCRNVAKAINFGIIYGMGVRKLRASLEPILKLLKEKLKGKPIVIRRPEEILEEYYSKYPVKAFMSKLTSKLWKKGSIRIKFDSELMGFMRDYRVPQRLSYKGANVVIQGTAAYVLKTAMKRAAAFIKKSGLNIHMLTCIHDEIAFEVDDSYDEVKIAQKLADVMSDTITFAVPIIASPKISAKSWGDAKELKKYVEGGRAA